MAPGHFSWGQFFLEANKEACYGCLGWSSKASPTYDRKFADFEILLKDNTLLHEILASR